MPNWRRAFVPGGTFFFTVVTDHRAPILGQPLARKLLGQVIRECQIRWPFEIEAIVLLPDHLQSIWSLPSGDSAYSKRWAWIKAQFTKRWLAAGGVEQQTTLGRVRDGRRGVWQPKFWEHTIEDVENFERCFNYIHDNPVKHGYVRCPRNWAWSSFHRWVRVRVYPSDWACWSGGHPPLSFADIEGSVGDFDANP